VIVRRPDGRLRAGQRVDVHSCGFV
jgi:hypothetical protein